MARELPIPFEGGCGCGRVRYRCTAAPFVAYACHCTGCRKLTSSAFATCVQVPAEALEQVAGRPRSAERIADSGNRIESWFCGDCGTALFTCNHARPRVRTLYVGSLDRAEDVDVAAHIWTASRLPWVTIPAEHRAFARAGDWRAAYGAERDRLAE